MKRKLLLFSLLLALMAPWAANAQSLFSEGFEGGTMPTGWTQDGPNTWTVGSGDYSSSTGAGMGTYNALITHVDRGNVTKLITPEIDLSSVTSAVLSFMHVQRSWTGDIDYLKVYYRTSSSGTWTQLVEYTNAVASWTTEEDIILPNTTATYQLAFEHTDNYGYGVGLDQVVITPPAACPKPTLGQAEYISEEGASFQWTENGSATQWQLQYSTSADFANPTTIDRNGIPAYAITGLAASTAYYVHVRSYCGDGEWTDWSNTVVFRTLCGVYGLPYAYGFEDAGDLECWTVSGSTSASTGIVSASDAPEGSKVFRFYYSERNAYLISPVFDGTSAGLSVTFQYMNSSTTTSYTEQFQVGYTTSATETDPTAFTYGETIYGQNEWVMYENLFPANTKRIAIKYIYTDGMYLRLDDFNFEVPSDCTKPTGLALTASGNTFTATWNGTADYYNIDINGTVTTIVTSPYTYTGDFATTYTVMVQANCGGETSGWTNPQSVTTDLCLTADQCELTFVLSDSYGDGWSNSVINVIDAATNTLIAAMAADNHNLSNTPTTDTKTLNVCNGRSIQFVWVNGGSSWDSEASYVVYDINNEVIFEGSGAMSEPVTYTVSCAVSSCRKPTDLVVADITARTANLSWTENGEATAWQVEVTDLDGGQVTTWDATTNPYQIVGLTQETHYSVRVKPDCDVEKWSDPVTFTTDIACPIPTDLTITDVTYNSATISWNGVADAYEMEYGISTGGGTTTFDFEDGTLQGWTNIIVNADNGEWLHSSAQPYGHDYTALAHGGTGFALCYSFIDYTGSFDTDAYLVSPNSYQINAGASMTFYYDMANDAYPEYFEVCVATATDPTADDFTAIWTLNDAKGNNNQKADVRMRDNTRSNNWREVTLDLSNYIGQTIWIAFHDVNYDAYEVWIDDVTIDAGAAGEVEWIAVEGTVTSPYTLEGLNDVTPYIVKVRAICGGEDGESGWSYTTFTTHGLCDAPTDLNVTDIYKDGATFNWTGLQDNYKLQYRTAAYFDDRNPEFFEDFEEGIPDTWTTIDADEDGNNWFALDDLMDIYSYYTTIPDWAHNSSNAAMSPSYANGAGAFNSDHWLITPQIELGGTLRFYARSIDATFKDSYEVLLSTTTADITEFTDTLQVMAAASANRWDEVLIDLSAYADQPGYIAIHHVSENMYFLVIDDFGIYPSEANVPAGEWVELPNQVTSPYPITGLALETAYEWQVRGLNRRCTDGTTDWSDIASFTSHDGIIFTTEGDWNVAGNWYLNEVPAEDKDVCIEAPATIPAGYDAVVGTVTFMEGGSITIADGGQLHHDTDSLMVTMEKNITAYTDAEGKDNYYLLAVPFMEGALVPEGMTATTDYDFYMYDNSKTQQEWRNNREEAIDTLKMFEGYLYANPADIQFSWSGSTYPTYGVAYTVAYDATETDDDILGWRLLGNPLTCNAYIYDSNWNPINVMYYDENGVMQTFVTGPVPPMQGFFVKITQNTTFYMVSFEVDSAKGVSSHVIGLEKKTDNSQENWKRK